MLMGVATMIAQRSTCSRAQVGAVLTLDGRILSTGYNGAPARLPHCDHSCNCGYPGKGGLLFDSKHLSNCDSLSPCSISVHAEANVVAFAARHGVITQDSHLYTTVSPCLACAQLLVNAGVVKVCYMHQYRDTSGLKLLSEAQVELEIIDLGASK